MNEKISALIRIEEISKNGKSKIYRDIATSLLLNLDRINDMKVSTIAKISKVSTSSVSRFSQMLGVSGFKELAFVLSWERDLQKNNQLLNTNTNFKTGGIDIKPIEKVFSSLLWATEKNEYKTIYNISNLLKQNKVLFLFGGGEYTQLLTIFKNDLMWEDKTVVYSSDLDNQIHYSRNISKNDVAFFVDDGMNSNEILSILQNVKASTSKICVFTFNQKIIEPFFYWLNFQTILKENKIAKLAFTILALKTIVSIMGGNNV